MPPAMNRRKFVQNSVLASAGAALAMNLSQRASSAAAAKTDADPAKMPTGKIGDMEISRLLLGGNLLTHYTHSRDLRYVYRLAEQYNSEEKILETLALAEDYGINTLVVHNVPKTIKILRKHRKRGGKIQWITCTAHALAGHGLRKFNEEIQELVDAGVVGATRIDPGHPDLDLPVTRGGGEDEIIGAEGEAASLAGNAGLMR